VFCWAQCRAPRRSRTTGFRTFSIIAADPATGELGVGVHLRAFAAGARVRSPSPASAPWRPRRRRTDRMAEGDSAAGAGADPRRSGENGSLMRIRTRPRGQVGVIRRQGPLRRVHGQTRSSIATPDPARRAFRAPGPAMSPAAPSREQGNTLASGAVVKAMADGCTNTAAARWPAPHERARRRTIEGWRHPRHAVGGHFVVRPLPANSESTGGACRPISEWTTRRIRSSSCARLLNITLACGEADRASGTARQSGHYSDAIAEQQKAIAIHAEQRADALRACRSGFAQAGEAQNALASLAEAVRRQPYLKKQAANDPLFAKMKELAEFNGSSCEGATRRRSRPGATVRRRRREGLGPCSCSSIVRCCTARPTPSTRAAGAREIADAFYADLYGLRNATGSGESLLDYSRGAEPRHLAARGARAALRSTICARDGAWSRCRTRISNAEIGRRASAGARRTGGSDRARLSGADTAGAEPGVAAAQPRDRLRLGCYYVQQLTLAENRPPAQRA